ncbi:MFS_1 domain-containing protein [Rhizoctonia solani AG-1 IA]|uniref:MFS_1 domain-containing protein n=1 Tax=Thanatephorus cucumeris (strain AG1-IA) TaxID=983506 RepID=L8WIC6_THACA|nr:MFS_1 domain-containing protein [Rhizoctonia solani AG-1 IA]
MDSRQREIRSHSIGCPLQLVVFYHLAVLCHTTKSIWGCLLSTPLLDYSPCRSAGYFLVIALFIGRISGTILIAVGCFFTGLAALLFAVIKPSLTYWAFGFPAAAVVVFGADFMFATGSIFVAKVALPHEQSLAGGIFNTLNQLGTAFGLAIASVVNNSVYRQSVRASGDEVESLLLGYRAAFWTCFGFGMAGA